MTVDETKSANDDSGVLGPIRLWCTINGRLLDTQTLTSQPVHAGGISKVMPLRRVCGTLSGAAMLAEWSFLENAFLRSESVEVSTFFDVTGERTISQGQLVPVALVYNGTDTVCAFEFEGNLKAPQ